MADSTEPTVGRRWRADYILASMIIVVLALVLVILGLLWSGRAVHDREGEVVLQVRAARTAMIAATRALTDAEVAAARYLATRDRRVLTHYEDAKAETRVHLAHVTNLVAADAEVAGLVRHISETIDHRLGRLDAEIARRGRITSAGVDESDYGAFREQAGTFSELLNSRIDDARRAEDQSRRNLDIAGVALAILSLIASALAILALRREREQWRLAHKAADEARASAIASDLAKTRFLAVASHDMRQPLHALTLYLTALEKRVDNPEAKSILEKMDRATQAMVGMFSSLLDLARIQAGVVRPEISAFALQDVIDRIVAEHPDGRLAPVRTTVMLRSDPLLIERILSNLVSNALKHAGSARIEVRRSQTNVSIAVVDNGPGIPHADRERIFDEFVRLSNRGEGLGLGLAIVKRIADLLHVPVEVQTAPGGGARFVVRVPVAADSHVDDATDDAHEIDAIFHNAPIVVLDDDALAREAISGVLEDAGASVRSCSDEASLNALVATGAPPRLLIMDLRIDGELSGIEIAKRARARLHPPPEVIVVTGDTGPETLSDLRSSGFAHLIKPVEPRALIEVAAARLRTPINAT